MKKVSIIMGIYNCENFLAESLISIVNQTYKNWELILCDDGSTDGTLKIAAEYVERDERIKLIRNNSNLGLAKTLNNCLQHSSGEYILRHDGDDIMVGRRIETQVAYMKKHDCDACGSGAYLFDKRGVWGTRQPVRFPNKNIMIKDGPFIHPTVIMKHEKLLEVGGYSENHLTMQRLEDYDLWMKFFEKGFMLHNIQEPLIYFREDHESYHRKSRRFRVSETRARLDACKRLNIPIFKRILALKPLVVMLVPKDSLKKYHARQANKA